VVQLVSIELRRLSSGLGRWSRWWRMPGWLVRVGRGSERELDARRRAGSNGSRRWRSQRAATAAAEVQQPDVRTPPPNRRVDCQATTRLAFPLFSFVRVMQMEVLQRSRR